MEIRMNFINIYLIMAKKAITLLKISIINVYVKIEIHN